MKVSIEYIVIGREKKYPDVAGEVYVPDEWTEEQIKKWFEERHHNLGGKGVKVINIEKGVFMDLKEAKQILSDNGFITERANDMGDWRKWFDEYEDSHPGCNFFDIQDMIKDLADECDEDWRRHCSEPEQAIDMSYEELCAKWGKPEDN